MASQANAAMWDDLRAYAMGGATGRVTEARAQRAFRTARMVESRAAAESAQERLTQLRETGAEAQARRNERAQERAARAARQTEEAQTRLARQQRAAQVTARQRRLNGVRGLSRFAASHAPQGARNAGARLRSLPTPGGLGGVVAALLFFNLAIVPVGTSGQSRLYLLWQVLTGAEALPTPAPPPSALEQAAQNASAIGDAAASAAATVASGGLIVIPPQLIPPLLAGLGQDVLGVLP